MRWSANHSSSSMVSRSVPSVLYMFRRRWLASQATEGAGPLCCAQTVAEGPMPHGNAQSLVIGAGAGESTALTVTDGQHGTALQQSAGRLVGVPIGCPAWVPSEMLLQAHDSE